MDWPACKQHVIVITSVITACQMSVSIILVVRISTRITHAVSIDDGNLTCAFSLAFVASSQIVSSTLLV